MWRGRSNKRSTVSGHKPISATSVVEAFSSRGRRRGRYVGKRTNQTKGMVAPALRSGKEVAQLMHKMYALDAIDPADTDSLEYAKAQLLVEQIQGRFPESEGWIPEPEKSMKSSDGFSVRADVFLSRTNMDTGKTEVWIVEVKTTFDVKAFVTSSYKKKQTIDATSKYEDHQRQLAVCLHVARDRNNYPDAIVSGTVLLCGGSARENMYFFWYDMNQLWDNSAFISGVAVDDVSILNELNQYRGVATDLEVQKAINVPIKSIIHTYMDDAAAPSLCVVATDNAVYGVYVYTTEYKKSQDNARLAVSSKSPCATSIVLFV